MSITRPQLAQLKSALWSNGEAHYVFGVFDGARDEMIADMISASPFRSNCLLSGEISSNLRSVAPYVVALDRDAAITDVLLTLSWGNAWGIFVASTLAPEPLRSHLASCLHVQDEAGNKLFFRYYDPWVLSQYLPTCLPQELTLFFGSALKACYAEDEEATSLAVFQYDEARSKLIEDVIRLLPA